MFGGTRSIWKRLKVVELAKTMQSCDYGENRKTASSLNVHHFPRRKRAFFLRSLLIFEAERQLLSHDHKRLMLAVTSVVKPPSFPPHNNSNYTFKRLLFPL